MAAYRGYDKKSKTHKKTNYLKKNTEQFTHDAFLGYKYVNQWRYIVFCSSSHSLKHYFKGTLIIYTLCWIEDMILNFYKNVKIQNPGL